MSYKSFCFVCVNEDTLLFFTQGENNASHEPDESHTGSTKRLFTLSIWKGGGGNP